MAYALPERQVIIPVTVPVGTTAAEAVELSGIRERFPGIELETAALGVFGRKVAPDTPLRPHDRVEIYRPLKIEPREARRLQARSQGKRRN